jgi:hypothetical protein
MSINDLPIEILTKILDSVFLHKYSGNTISYVGNLTKCSLVECRNEKQCHHLGILEAIPLKNIILTCKLWYIIIQDHRYKIYTSSIEYQEDIYTSSIQNANKRIFCTLNF